MSPPVVQQGLETLSGRQTSSGYPETRLVHLTEQGSEPHGGEGDAVSTRASTQQLERPGGGSWPSHKEPVHADALKVVLRMEPGRHQEGLEEQADAAIDVYALAR